MDLKFKMRLLLYQTINDDSVEYTFTDDGGVYGLSFQRKSSWQ
jgi:hypothetical protein